MFHADDHIRLMGLDAARPMRRRRDAGVRDQARNTDIDSFLERIGLAGRVRRR
ncbi:hypothetical protein [Marinicauda salina]|uniref:hypothetical protein n=1 Tax=Marinicauda salina TaxID=2135793 RepID=UPI001304E8C8|nr:hypothetical protein [Marinicauda salina]